ncbi:stage II sporulation protein E [Lachnospiraceae bacterium TWA4]|nr:stage II sporulation protein E [Lachnospiraceae bacterium TWA4]
MKKIDILRITLALIGTGLFVIAFGNIELPLIVLVLIISYKYGTEIGCICGSLSGFILAGINGQISSIALLCMGGLVAGFFSSLGRVCTVISFLAILIGLDNFYSLGIIGWNALAICGIYFLLPSNVLKRKISLRKPRKSKESQVIALHLKEMSKSLDSLAKYFSDKNLPTEEAMTVEDSEWIERYIDSQRAIYTQFEQMSQMIKNLANKCQNLRPVEQRTYKNLKRKLKLYQIEVDKMVILENEFHRQEIYMNVRTSGKKYLTVRDVALSLSNETKKHWRSSLENQLVINHEFSEVKFEEEPNFFVFHGLSRVVKSGEEFSGDTFSTKSLPNGKILFCLSDGMGTGRKAYLESQLAVDLLEQLLETGFELDAAANFINHVLLFYRRTQHPTTLDICVFDTYTGEGKMLKMGAPKCFLKRQNEVTQIGNFGLPLGMINEAKFCSETITFKEDDLLIMVTDGVLDQIEVRNREEIFEQMINEYSKTNVKEEALWLMNKVLAENEEAKDDMTILTIGFRSYGNSKKRNEIK